MSFVEGFEVKKDLNNREFFNMIIHIDKLPEVQTQLIHRDPTTGREFYYGETIDGFVNFFTCGIEDERHDKNYRWSSRDGIFNGLFKKKSIEVTYVIDNIAYVGHMTVTRVERLLGSLPYTISIRKEYCFGNEVVYGIKKI